LQEQIVLEGRTTIKSKIFVHNFVCTDLRRTSFVREVQTSAAFQREREKRTETDAKSESDRELDMI
jgi:hypothetical protein